MRWRRLFSSHFQSLLVKVSISNRMLLICCWILFFSTFLVLIGFPSKKLNFKPQWKKFGAVKFGEQLGQGISPFLLIKRPGKVNLSSSVKMLAVWLVAQSCWNNVSSLTKSSKDQVKPKQFLLVYSRLTRNIDFCTTPKFSLDNSQLEYCDQVKNLRLTITNNLK